MAYKAPSGLMAKPEDREQFQSFVLTEDGAPYGRLYIANDIWESLKPGQERLLFHVQEYGRFWLQIEHAGQ
jgi:hypothetical protein